MTPFEYLFIDIDDAAPVPQKKALAFSCAGSRPIRPEEGGTPIHSDIITDAVREGIHDASVVIPDVELVIVKTPIISYIPATEAENIAN